MFGKVIGALVGQEIGKRQGGHGTAGMIAGTVAVTALRRMGPFGLVLGGAYVAKKAYDRLRVSRASST
jgi:hypothetical protein